MRCVKLIILSFSALLFAQKIFSQDLQYYLSGETAAVANNGDGFGGSKYTNKEYIIPEVIQYGGLRYTVNKIGDCAFENSITEKIVMPNTITSIGREAFRNCKKITSMIIPSSVNYFRSVELSDASYYAFNGCYLLRELIYLPQTAPVGWTATSRTYVPDKQSYSTPYYSMNDAHVIEMITFNQSTFLYSGQAPTPSWTNNIEGYTASMNMPVLNGNVGNHAVWIPVTFTKGDESFTAKVVYRYTVKAAKLTVKVSNVSREYGDNNPEFNISYSGFVNGENESVISTLPTVSTTATKTSKVGEYPISISGCVASNYKFVYEPGVLTITKAPLSAKVKDATKVYGTQNPAFTIDYNGLKNDEEKPAWTPVPTFQTDATQKSNVGLYDVEAINGVPVNYELVNITPGTLSIIPAPLTIKANDATRKYYSDEPNFNYTCSGFVNGEDKSVLTTEPTISTSVTKASDVGTYEIKVSGAESKNYSISYTNGTLTITPRTLIASVGNYERPYNEDNPDFVVAYDGFVGSDNEKSLAVKPIATTTATKTTDVGSYPITISGGSADNYIFTYTSGILTINKAEQNITWEQDLTGLRIGDQIELNAKVSSDLPITFTIDNSEVAEIYSSGKKSYLDCKTEGQAQIMAVQEGNKNYYSSPRIRKSVDVSSNKFKLIYLVNDEEYKIVSYNYGATISPEQSPIKKGYTFSGWSEIPSTMPNHDVTVTGTFSVDLYAPITIQADDKTRTYGENNPTLTYNVKDGEIYGSGKPIVRCAATAKSRVGTYPITIEKGTVTNTNVKYVSGTMTISKAPLTIEGGTYTIKQGDPIPQFTLNYKGFKNGETEKELTTQPTVICLATSESKPGRYDIVLKGATADNYEISYVKGTLIIRDRFALKGDMNDDGVIDVTDVVELIDLILSGE